MSPNKQKYYFPKKRADFSLQFVRVKSTGRLDAFITVNGCENGSSIFTDQDINDMNAEYLARSFAGSDLIDNFDRAWLIKFFKTYIRISEAKLKSTPIEPKPLQNVRMEEGSTVNLNGIPHMLRDRTGYHEDEHYSSLTKAEQARRQKMLPENWQIKKMKQHG